MLFANNQFSYIVSQCLELVLDITEGVYSFLEMHYTSPDETSEASDISPGYKTKLGYGKKKGADISGFIDELNMAAFITDNLIIQQVVDVLRLGDLIKSKVKTTAAACFDSAGNVVINASVYTGVVLKKEEEAGTVSTALVENMEMVKSTVSIAKTAAELAQSITRIVAKGEEPAAKTTPTAATPTAIPAGGTYATQVELYCASPEDAEIRYTVDETSPTKDNSFLYADPIPITAVKVTIKAIAIKTDWKDSEVLTAVYTPQVCTPTATPPAGQVAPRTNISLACATTGGVTIKYTTNGTDPTGAAASTYANPIQITGNTTIKAIAIKGGWTNSGVLTAVYTV